MDLGDWFIDMGYRQIRWIIDGALDTSDSCTFDISRMKLVVFFLFILSVYSSAGDRDSLFLNCLKKCTFSCRESPPLSLALRILLWDCPSNCKYECMHQVTREYKQQGQKVLQYYGKWPFKRFAFHFHPSGLFFHQSQALPDFWEFRNLLLLFFQSSMDYSITVDSRK
jgi:hypothetical protein